MSNTAASALTLARPVISRMPRLLPQPSQQRRVRRAMLPRQVDHPRAAEIFYRLRALEVHGSSDDAGEPGALLRDDAQLVALVVAERRVREQPRRLHEDVVQRAADLALHG